MNFIAENLAFLRKNKKYTQAEISSRLDIPVSTYASWEYGKAEPNVDNIVKICEIFVVTPSDLLLRRLAHSQHAEKTPPPKGRQKKHSSYEIEEHIPLALSEPDPPPYITSRKAAQSAVSDSAIEEMRNRIRILEDNQQKIMKQMGLVNGKSKKSPKSPF